MKIVCIIGSLRDLSYNRAVFNTLKDVAPDGVQFVEAPIGDLPLFNTDKEADLPKAVQEFKQAFEGADGILIISPEYNRSLPGVLKNAIDWGSRPNDGGVFKGVPAASMGATPGRLGTAPSQMHLKGILAYLGTKQMGRPEFYLDHVDQKVSEDGATITDEKTREYMKEYLETFINHINQ